MQSPIRNVLYSEASCSKKYSGAENLIDLAQSSPDLTSKRGDPFLCVHVLSDVYNLYWLDTCQVVPSVLAEYDVFLVSINKMH
jgi:hypothetical protein